MNFRGYELDSQPTFFLIRQSIAAPLCRQLRGEDAAQLLMPSDKISVVGQPYAESSASRQLVADDVEERSLCTINIRWTIIMM
jgi:hypothetical protein